MGVRSSLRKTLALTLLVFIVATLLALGVFKAVTLATGSFDSVVELLQRMAEVIDTARTRLPIWAQAYLPENIADVQSAIANWLRGHASQLGIFGQDIGRFLFHLAVGLVVGGLIAVQTASPHGQPGPLVLALERRMVVLSGAFRNIVFSQARISALNTSLTAIYLEIVLPAFDVHLPLVKTMIAVTFFVGLLPVLGNLISTPVVFIVSLSVSPTVSGGGPRLSPSSSISSNISPTRASSAQRIPGARVGTVDRRMLVMEAAFGVPGVIAAPIFYAYLKDELKTRGIALGADHICHPSSQGTAKQMSNPKPH